jgi:hypothetical protein
MIDGDRARLTVLGDPSAIERLGDGPSLTCSDGELAERIHPPNLNYRIHKDHYWQLFSSHRSGLGG